MKKIIYIILTITCLFFITGNERIYAHSGGFGIFGFGVTVDYAETDNNDDSGVYLNFRTGIHHMLSAFINIDTGYRFNENSLNGKIGLSAMLFIMGLDFGFAYAYRFNDYDPVNENKNWGPFAPAGYIGLGILLPFRTFPVFLSIGGIFYGNGHEDEFYISATFLLNLMGG